MSCKKGGFVANRHNNLRDLTTKILSEVCSDTEIESEVVPLSEKTQGIKLEIDLTKRDLMFKHVVFEKGAASIF